LTAQKLNEIKGNNILPVFLTLEIPNNLYNSPNNINNLLKMNQIANLNQNDVLNNSIAMSNKNINSNIATTQYKAYNLE
jgi:hypothetical protein